MADLPAIQTVPVSTAGPQRFKYPNQLGSAPFEKWILFEVKSGRHVVRNKVIPEGGTNLDRTLASIGLYLSESALVDSILVCYDESPLGAFVGAAVELLAQSGQNMFDMNFSFSENTSGGLADKLSAITSEAMRVYGDIKTAVRDHWQDALKADIFKAVDQITGGAGRAITGKRPNPRTDLLFDTQKYRTRELSFLLIPRNVQEAQQIDNIIHAFQYYMLPAYLGPEQQNRTSGFGSFLMGFPYEFEISLLQNDKVMEHVNKIGRSVLTNVAIDHAAGGKAAFVEQGGELYPVATKLTLSFQEVRLLGRDSTEIQRAGSAPLEDPRLK
jgi:hypothetical protein